MTGRGFVCSLPHTGLSQLWVHFAKFQFGLKFSGFLNLLQPKDLRDEIVLAVNRPLAGEAEALLQPQHGLEPLDGSPGRVERAKATDPRHGLLHSGVVTLDPLLKMLPDMMDGIGWQQPVLDRGSDCS